MAKFIPSSTIEAISGSVGSNTYSRVKSGGIIKAKSYPGSVHPYTITDKQKAQNTSFGTNSALWQSLSYSQRDGWNGAAARRVITNIFGIRYHQSGFNLFTSVNHNRKLINVDPVLDCPALILPIQLNSFHILYRDPGHPSFHLAFPGLTTDMNCSCLIYATAVVSNGIQYVQNKYRLIDILPGGVSDYYDILAQYELLYGGIRTGHKIFIKLRPICATSGIAGTSIRNSIFI